MAKTLAQTLTAKINDMFDVSYSDSHILRLLSTEHPEVAAYLVGKWEPTDPTMAGEALDNLRIWFGC
jgi:hypothetical protein